MVVNTTFDYSKYVYTVILVACNLAFVCMTAFVTDELFIFLLHQGHVIFHIRTHYGWYEVHFKDVHEMGIDVHHIWDVRRNPWSFRWQFCITVVISRFYVYYTHNTVYFSYSNSLCSETLHIAYGKLWFCVHCTHT